MLVLSRHRDEEIMIGDDVIVKIVDIRGDKVRLGFSAPKHVQIHRKEIHDLIQKEKKQAKAKTIGDMDSVQMDVVHQLNLDNAVARNFPLKE